MRKLFNSQYKITQEYNARPEYYSKFGLKGHEGIDLIPTTSDFTVLSLEDGIVVKDDDVAGDPRTDAYGINVTIWYPSLKKATQYCHLKSNSVSNGQTVTKGQKIGVMGASGNTSGAHVHLNLFEVDDNGVRQNKSNGYLGGINPKPFLEESGEPMATISQKELDDIRTARDKHYNELQKANETIANLNSQINDKNRQLDDLNKQLSNTMNNLLLIETEKNGLEDKLNDTKIKLEDSEKYLQQAFTTRDTLLLENENLRRSNAQLKRRIDEGKPKTFTEKLKFLFG